MRTALSDMCNCSADVDKRRSRAWHFVANASHLKPKKNDFDTVRLVTPTLTQLSFRLYGNWQTTMCTANASTNANGRLDVELYYPLNAVFVVSFFRLCHRLFTICSPWFCGSAATMNPNTAGSVKPIKWNRNSFFPVLLDVRRACDDIGTLFTFATIFFFVFLYLSKTIFGLCVASMVTTKDVCFDGIYWNRYSYSSVKFEVEIGRRYHLDRAIDTHYYDWKGHEQEPTRKK